MTDKDLINSLLKQVKDDYETAKDLLEDKHYVQCLFFGHLVLEKLLKALVIKKTKKLYPPIHDLDKLAKKTGINLDMSQKEDFKEINLYNVQARYDNIKLAFYKKANPAYTEKWFNKIRGYVKWFRDQF